METSKPSRALRIGLPLVLVAAAAMTARAFDTTWIAPGNSLSSQQLKGNLDEAQTRLAALEAWQAKVTQGSSYSLGAMYCGATGNTPGDLSALTAPGAGYAKARAACQTSCSSPTAHTCTSDELVRSRTLGHQPGVVGWYATGTFAARVDSASDWVMDCVSWSNGTSAREGAVWAGYGASASVCNGLFPVLCCD